MSTNGINTTDEADMTECDGEKVVTMMDVLQEQEEFEEDANAVLGASDDKNCTYSKGYIKRQAIYACLTCCVEAKHDASKRAGVCLACSLTCHENHELVELYTKRNFRCDCGNPKFNSHPCQFTPDKTELNEDNNYNQNFSGLYCICHRPYPDPESTFEDEMIQCIICEDWLHSTHLDATVPTNEQYAEMICKGCMEKNEFIHDYSDFAINNESNDIDIVTINGSEITLANTTSETNETLEPIVSNGVMKSSESSNKNETKEEMDVDTPAEEKDVINEKADSNKKVLINESHMNEVEKIPESTDTVIKNVVDTDKTEGTATLNAVDADKTEGTDTFSAVDTDTTEGTDTLNEIAMDTDKTEDTDTLNAVDTAKTEDTDTSNAVKTDKTEGTDTLNEIAMDTDKTEKEITSNMKDTEKSDKTIQPEAAKDSSGSLVNNSENKISDSLNNDDEISSKQNDTITDRSKKTSDLKSETEQNLEQKIHNETEKTEQTETSSINKECDKDEEPTDDSNSNMDPSKLNLVEGDTGNQQVSNANDMEKNENKSEESPEKAKLNCIEEPVEDPEKKDDKDPNESADIENHEKFPTESGMESAQNQIESGLEFATTESDIESTKTDSGVDSVSKNEIESKPTDSATESEPTKSGDGCLSSESKEQSVPVETEVQSAQVENEATQISSDQSSNKNDQVSEDSELSSNGQENKRKLSTEQTETDKIVTKKAKLDESMQCLRPKGIKRRFNGATFWPSNFRQKLCTCNECISMYKDLSVLFLIDPEDTVSAYETLGKEKINGAPASQYEKGLLALSSLDRVQQINALTEYNRMRDKLLDFLKSFKDRKEIVKEEDIKAFFAGMKPKREPDGVYFCR